MKKRQPIYIVPTRYGFLYGALVLAFLVIGTIYESNSFLFATAALVSFGLICMHQTHLNVNQIVIRDLEFESGFSGQTVRWKLRIHNNAQVTSFSINVRDAVIDVPPGDSFTENIAVTLRERGEVRLTELKFSSTYPFGLFYAWKWWSGDSSFYVYPKLLTHYHLPSTIQYRQSLEGGQEDFVGHREYNAGDSPRHIDWKIEARRQKIMVKVFDSSQPEAILLDWSSTPGSNIEERLSILAGAVHECYKSQRPFKLNLPGAETLNVGSTFGSRTYYRQCLRALALFEGGDESAA